MLTFNFSPFPVLQTENLILNRLTNDDIDDFFAMRSNIGSMQYIARPLAKTKQDAIEVIEKTNKIVDNNEGINWAIRYKNNSKLMGTIGFYRAMPENHRAEIGYQLHPDFHRKGIMSEAIKEVIKYGFDEMKLHSILAVIDPRNVASETLLQKNGFIKEAHFKEDFLFEENFLDSVHYSLLATNFKNKKP